MNTRRFKELGKITTRNDELITREVVISFNQETKKYQIIQDETKDRGGFKVRYHMGAAMCMDKEQLIELYGIIQDILDDIDLPFVPQTYDTEEDFLVK